MQCSHTNVNKTTSVKTRTTSVSCDDQLTTMITRHDLSSTQHS